MKRLYEYDEDSMSSSTIYVGTANDVCLLCKKMWRHPEFLFSHCQFPKFNMKKMYGISVTYDVRGYYHVSVLNSDTIVWGIVEGYYKEEK